MSRYTASTADAATEARAKREALQEEASPQASPS